MQMTMSCGFVYSSLEIPGDTCEYLSHIERLRLVFLVKKTMVGTDELVTYELLIDDVQSNSVKLFAYSIEVIVIFPDGIHVYVPFSSHNLPNCRYATYVTGPVCEVSSFWNGCCADDFRIEWVPREIVVNIDMVSTNDTARLKLVETCPYGAR